MSWAILADIETGAGRPDLAAQARSRARECFLAYRRDGGENHRAAGRIASAVTQQLLTDNPASAIATLDELLAPAELHDRTRAFVVALRAIAAGSRDRGLADVTALDYLMAAEVVLLIDALEAAAAGAA
jgi:hypothetical protein